MAGYRFEGDSPEGQEPQPGLAGKQIASDGCMAMNLLNARFLANVQDAERTLTHSTERLAGASIASCVIKCDEHCPCHCNAAANPYLHHPHKRWCVFAACCVCTVCAVATVAATAFNELALIAYQIAAMMCMCQFNHLCGWPVACGCCNQGRDQCCCLHRRPSLNTRHSFAFASGVLCISL